MKPHLFSVLYCVALTHGWLCIECNYSFILIAQHTPICIVRNDSGCTKFDSLPQCAVKEIGFYCIIAIHWMRVARYWVLPLNHEWALRTNLNAVVTIPSTIANISRFSLYTTISPMQHLWPSE